MQPISYNGAKIYKGAVFRFSFRLSRAGEYVDPDDVIFTLSTKAGGTEVFETSYAESPTFISVDDDQIWTVEIPASETDSIDDAELYMQVDIIEDSSRERWIIGNARVLENATG